MSDCINLRERLGARFRITFDPSCEIRDDPWMMQIPCRFGVIYPYGGDKLCVEVDYRPNVAAALARVPGVACIQNGDDEKTFRFPAELFPVVAKIVRPHRVAQMGEDQKRAAIERLTRFQFRPAKCQKHAATPPPRRRRTLPEPQGDKEATEPNRGPF